MDPVPRRARARVEATFAVSRDWSEGSGEPARPSAFDSQFVVELRPQWRSVLTVARLAAVSGVDARR